VQAGIRYLAQGYDDEYSVQYNENDAQADYAHQPVPLAEQKQGREDAQ